ncbi:MAG TPA: hypothetical protein VG496_00735 [Myxococcales bacterium]|nr:hypothetical protein [Myxococcales bacterium]
MVPNELDDEALVTAFERAELGSSEFRHREHVRAAYVYLARHGDFAEAAHRFRTALRRFAAAHGVANRYHETLTWAYLALINDRMHGAPLEGSVALLRRCPELLDGRALLGRYYDVDALLRSPRARDVFLLPERL